MAKVKKGKGTATRASLSRKVAKRHKKAEGVLDAGDLLVFLEACGYGCVETRGLCEADVDWGKWVARPPSERNRLTESLLHLIPGQWLCVANREDDPDMAREIRVPGKSREEAMSIALARAIKAEKKPAKRRPRAA